MTEYKENKLTEILYKAVGYPGKMISMSKSTYRIEHPKNKVYFNACIYQITDNKPVQIWYGDIDLTKSTDRLKEAAKITKQKFYVTPEHPYRFDFNEVSVQNMLQDEDVIAFGE